MTKFKVGDEVKCVKTEKPRWLTPGKIYTIKGYNDSGSPTVLDDLKESCDTRLGEFILVSTSYSSLRARIEALDNGWTKEADDILQEITYLRGINGVWHSINIATHHDSDSYYCKIEIWRCCSPKQVVATFTYSSQCEKNRAFKQALLWLLDHSDIKKDDKQEKIAEIKKQVEELNKKISELENG